jgi:hypothetical protein
MNDNNWMGQLEDQITEMLADTKQVKFNTHKNRKLFTGKLVGLIKEAVHRNTVPMEKNKSLRIQEAITRPNPNKEVGHTVMTEGKSSEGDEVLKHVTAQKKTSFRSW